MSRIHLALNTDHFEESIEFYGKLFKQPPAKIRPDWAKFDLSNPPLNLTLNRRERAAAPADINHMGIELDSSEAVTQMDKHLQQQGLITIPEQDVTCCYARQDKIWVSDPNGHSWEFFYVKADA